MRRLAAILLLLGSQSLAAQGRVVVVDRGAGGSGSALEAVLARPHRVVEPDTGWFRYRRGNESAVSLVILGRTAAIEGTVNGDVVVVDGDLFIRPGARITGRAIAIGGGVYPSALGVVSGGTASYRDNTFAIVRDGDTWRLSYQSEYADASPPLLFPGVFGVRMPTYDRVNGLSVPFGPAFSAFGSKLQVTPLVTYRSDLGAIDPTVTVDARLSRRLRLEASAGRGSFTNEGWIWSNLVNSFSALTSGTDTRNWYRADRAEATLHRLYEFTQWQVEPFAGLLAEDAWSVGPAVGERRGPWSVFGRTDTLGMHRPNPPVSDRGLISLLGGMRVLFESPDVTARGTTRAEANVGTLSQDDIAGVVNRWIQVTSDMGVKFPTIRDHEYALDVHWMTTAGDTPPPQRWGYLGGAGTLPFLDLLEQGGDEVLLVDQRYAIPVPSVRLGFLGEPTLILRHRLGSAGLGALADFEQVVGVGVIVALVRVEVQVDPVGGKARVSTGFSFSR